MTPTISFEEMEAAARRVAEGKKDIVIPPASNRLRVVSIDSDPYSRLGPWAVAVTDYLSRCTEMCPAVFQVKLHAEVFALWQPISGIDPGDAELTAAREVEAFIQAFEDAHDDTPTARELAALFAAWRLDRIAERLAPREATA